MSVENSKVSFIVPIFNVDPYLKASLDSIAHQTYQNFEVIMIDDGSTDHSELIAKSYARKDSRFEYIKTKNNGQSHARNIGLSRVKGKFISFVDPDDSLEKNFLKNLINAFDDDTLIASYLFPSTKYNKHSISKKITVDDFFSMMFSGIIGTVVWNKLFRANILEKVRFPEGQVHEEIEFFRQILHVINDYEVVVVNEKHQYRYREVRKGNTKSTFDPKRIVGAKDETNLILDLKKMQKSKSVEVVNLDTLVFLKNFIQEVDDIDFKKEAVTIFDELYAHVNKVKLFFIKPIWLLSIVKFRLRQRNE
ncbi:MULTISPECIES: glycosyltransferase family 2 protein [Leuconostoc]|uniref:GT n=1 Tax=Leuconostoc mesenteroides TaxID=1245 RepID=A0A7S6VG32_LEUME|nr:MULTISPECIES: glycosyltransferase family 2 protein [Leuconostoc]MCT3049762.1 glycosyltransferase family 2 protein [Leuconostoc mesenteroides]MCT4403062.1 glycosyltransferase family 2 protein [Leuconostoc suionicum]QOW38003.1 GT [Leuconostoc mesenteroides]